MSSFTSYKTKDARWWIRYLHYDRVDRHHRAEEQAQGTDNESYVVENRRFLDFNHDEAYKINGNRTESQEYMRKDSKYQKI